LVDTETDSKFDLVPTGCLWLALHQYLNRRNCKGQKLGHRFIGPSSSEEHEQFGGWVVYDNAALYDCRTGLYLKAGVALKGREPEPLVVWRIAKDDNQHNWSLLVVDFNYEGEGVEIRPVSPGDWGKSSKQVPRVNRCKMNHGIMCRARIITSAWGQPGN
jgi:hypothetical protein